MNKELSSQKFPTDVVKRAFLRCWSNQSSTFWSEDNPARGQCSVTALVVQDFFGGAILKTETAGGWHFYNNVDGVRYDLTVDQFDIMPNYLDLTSDRSEAFSDTNEAQYEFLSKKFKLVLSQILS